MTTHKSNGLEYHTVVFVGLEDGAYFSFARESVEETCNFFVALSRAKRRVYFTFSASRAADRNGRTTRSALRPLYQLLANAGVSVERVVTKGLLIQPMSAGYHRRFTVLLRSFDFEGSRNHP